MAKIKGRKNDHIKIAAQENVTPGYNYWNDVKLIHDALPEVNYEEIDTSVDVLGKKLDFPFIVTAITGGFEGAKKINGNIAKACAELGIGMGVGSERAALEGYNADSYEIVKEYDVPLVIGNIGVAQLIDQKRKKAITEDDLDKAIELVDADYLGIHLNYLQELIQPEGDTNAKGCYDVIRDYARKYPLIVKETGAGMSGLTAKKLYDVGVRAVDIAGMGGTSFAAIEMHRSLKNDNILKAAMGSTFYDWGIPSPVSLLCTEACIPTIASGGINTGLDVARAMAMGAMCAGGANLVLRSAMDSYESVRDALILIKEELKAAMMLTGSQNIKQLSEQEYVLVGETKQWMDEYE